MIQYFGFKVMPYDLSKTTHDLFSKYTANENDWSAIYIQKNHQHCMSYIYTKYELFKEVCLMKFKFNENINFIQIDHPKLAEGKVSSKEKADIVKEILRNNYNLQISDKPLMDTLGNLGIGLIMEDSDQQYEYIVPHRLMQLQKCYQYEILFRFLRHESRIFRTVKIIHSNIEQIPEQEFQDKIHKWPIPNI